MNTLKKILIIMVFGVASNLHARVLTGFTGAPYSHPIAGTPLQIQQAQQEAAKKPSTLEQLVNAQPSTEINLKDIQEEDLVIAKIDALKVEDAVKKELKRIIKKQKNHDKLDTIITNQRIIMVLLAALTAKLVVYDLYIANKNHKAAQ